MLNYHVVCVDGELHEAAGRKGREGGERRKEREGSEVRQVSKEGVKDRGEGERE